MTWEDRRYLQDVIDAEVFIMYPGGLVERSLQRRQAALARVDDMEMPARLAHTRGALREVMQYITPAPSCE